MRPQTRGPQRRSQRTEFRRDRRQRDRCQAPAYDLPAIRPVTLETEPADPAVYAAEVHADAAADAGVYA